VTTTHALRVGWLAALVSLGLASPSAAQTPAAPPTTASTAATPESDPKAQSIRALEQKLEAAERYMLGLRAELDALKSGAPPPGAVPPPPVRPPEVARTTPPPMPTPAPPTAAEDEPIPEEDRPVFTPAFLRQAQAVLIPRHRLEVTPSLFHSFDDSNILAVQGLDILETIFIGTINVEKQRRHGLTAQLDGRYGITDRVQANLTVPYRYIYSQLSAPRQVQRIGDEEISDRTVHTNYIGDIEFGASFHALREKGWRPDLILTLSTKTRTGLASYDIDLRDSEVATGTGFWGVRGQATVVKVTDPGILFASGSYLYHIEDHVNGFDVNPGDIFQLSAGYGFALNPFLSLTTRIEANYVEALQLDGDWIDGTELWLSTLSFGATYGVSRNMALDLAFEIGLTDDTPDFRFSIGAPIQIRLPPWRQLLRLDRKP
jgi:hypothetical protein